MRRLHTPLVVLLSLVLGGCGAVVVVAETPQTALASAAQTTGQLKSVRYDFTGNIALQLPQAQAQSLGLAGGTLAIDFTGSGEAVLPDRSHTTVAIRMGSISATTETVVIGATAYVKNPMTGRWTSAAASGGTGASSLTQADPVSYAQLLDTAQTITDLGDTSLDGVAVHHYRLVPDKTKLLARLQSLPAYKSPPAQQLFRLIMDHGTLTLEVWFGKQDHLVRRLSTDASVSLDAAALKAALGSALPAGTEVQMTEHTLINYHDFNAPVTVTAPSLS